MGKMEKKSYIFFEIKQNARVKIYSVCAYLFQIMRKQFREFVLKINIFDDQFFLTDSYYKM